MILKEYFCSLSIFFLLSYTLPGNTINFGNDKDSKLTLISLPLMKSLGIHQGIIVENNKNKIKNIHNFKRFSYNFLQITYQNVKKLYELFSNDSFLKIPVNTVIIFEEDNILDIIWILEKLEKVIRIFKLIF